MKANSTSIASTFSISRRRMVVPIYKQWTANQIRIQIVEQDNIIQLLAFFENFSHADAMNFQLRVTDTYEKSDKGGKPSLRMVDCKFALPVEERKGEGKMGKEEGRLTGWAGTKRRFVCLDQIEYPGEHDDVLIGFDSAESKLHICLPNMCHQWIAIQSTDRLLSTGSIRRGTSVRHDEAEIHPPKENLMMLLLLSYQKETPSGLSSPMGFHNSPRTGRRFS